MSSSALEEPTSTSPLRTQTTSACSIRIFASFASELVARTSDVPTSPRAGPFVGPPVVTARAGQLGTRAISAHVYRVL